MLCLEPGCDLKENTKWIGFAILTDKAFGNTHIIVYNEIFKQKLDIPKKKKIKINANYF